MINFHSIKLPGVKFEGEIQNQHKKVIFEDRHNVIEILLGRYSHNGMDYVVAGHNCHVGDVSVSMKPTPENGVYMNERYATISMLCYLHETYGKQWPSEVVKIIELSIWENRQTSFFD